MKLQQFFANDDGSLPELDVACSDPVPLLLRLLEGGVSDATKGGVVVQSVGIAPSQPFTGHLDAARVRDGAAESFHHVLRGARGSSCTIPDLGALVTPRSLILDYRMGAEWDALRIESLLQLLVDLESFGGNVSVARWWGRDAQGAFSAAMREVRHGA